MKPSYEELETRVAELEAWKSDWELRYPDILLARERLDLSLSAGNLAWWEMDVKTGTVEANETKPRMLGYEPSDFSLCHYTKYTELIHADDFPDAMEAMRRHLYGEFPYYESEYRIRGKDGAYRWFYDRGAITERDKSGVALTVKGVVLDVTERKTYQIRLEQTLKEKEFLIQEIHHRVKNNLNLISMVIFFMQNELTDSKARSSFLQLSNRIQTMALLHQFLYQEEDSSTLDLGEYVGELSDAFVASLGGTPEIAIEKNLVSIRFDHNHAVKVGLIVNEILTNALKHAFAEKRQGNIRLALSMDENDTIELLITNNGPPIDSEKWRSSDSLGHNLMFGFASDLEGTLDVQNNPHPEFCIRFPRIQKT